MTHRTQSALIAIAIFLIVTAAAFLQAQTRPRPKQLGLGNTSNETEMIVGLSAPEGGPITPMRVSIETPVFIEAQPDGSHILKSLRPAEVPLWEQRESPDPTQPTHETTLKPATKGRIKVFKNGILLPEDAYTITTGELSATITWEAGAAIAPSDVLTVFYWAN